MKKEIFEEIVNKKANFVFDENMESFRETIDRWFSSHLDFQINSGWWQESDAFQKHLLKNKEIYLENIKKRIINETFYKIEQLDYLFQHKDFPGDL